MIISFISHYIRKANVTHAGTIQAPSRAEGPGKGARRGQRELRMRLREIPLLWAVGNGEEALLKGYMFISG